MSDEHYCYPPDYRVLINKLNIRDADVLDYYEREFVTARIDVGVPIGNFDLSHLRAIHRHLFQDVYDWAGELRTVEIFKSGSQFQFLRYIQTGMADVHRRIVEQNYLRGLSPQAFALTAGEIMGDVNYVHPFREGNGRTQLLYLKQLAEQAGHPIDLARLDKAAWMNACRAAHIGEYDAIGRCIAAAIEAELDTDGEEASDE